MTHSPRPFPHERTQLLQHQHFLSIDEAAMSACSSNARHYLSSSESSFSSASDSESNTGSDVSSDNLDVGLIGTSEAQKKFRRLRRIFLNRPAKMKEKKKEKRRSPRQRPRSPLERSSSRCAMTRRHRRKDSISSSSNDEGTQSLGRCSRLNPSKRPLQVAIDQHLEGLCEQMKRHSAQRDSTANQVHSMLEQAVDELRFLKKQEERALESQVRLIRESYALRLEVFQQQYLSKVAEIEDEMYVSIQKRQEECDATVLVAAKKLQEQTQCALLKDLPLVNNEPFGEKIDSSSFSTASSSASPLKVQRQNNTRHHRSHPLKSPLFSPRVALIPKQASPVSRQRAKLQALEDKLATFSPGSLNRVRSELATPHRRDKAERLPLHQKRAPNPSRPLRNDSAAGNVKKKEWQPSPLSPLRKGPSYWKNGISLESRTDGIDLGTSSTESDQEQSAATSTARRRSPPSLLNQRFLRPEEEEELRHLRASIGLAKDWMAKNSQV